MTDNQQRTVVGFLIVLAIGFLVWWFMPGEPERLPDPVGETELIPPQVEPEP